MAAFWILLLVVATYLLTISIIVVGQQVGVLAGVIMFALSVFGAYRLFQRNLTRL
jgi:uncharacterized membrane protein